MKAFILLATLLLSFSAMALSFDVKGNGSIRHSGDFPGHPYFTFFKDEVKAQLAKRIDGITFTNQNAEIIITYSYATIVESIRSLFPMGGIYATVYIPHTGEKHVIQFDILLKVNDGGNITLKKSSAKKLARKVAKLLSEF